MLKHRVIKGWEMDDAKSDQENIDRNLNSLESAPLSLGEKVFLKENILKYLD